MSGTAPAVGLTAQYTAIVTLSNGATQNLTGSGGRLLEPEVLTSCEALRGHPRRDHRAGSSVHGSKRPRRFLERGGRGQAERMLRGAPNLHEPALRSGFDSACPRHLTPPTSPAPPTSPTPPPTSPTPPPPPTPTTTQNIANYMAGLHAQTRYELGFAGNRPRTQRGWAGTLNTGATLSASRNLYVSYVQSFVSQSLAYVGQVSRGAAIDRAAVSALFSMYEATDVTDAHSFYSGAPFAFVMGMLPPVSVSCAPPRQDHGRLCPGDLAASVRRETRYCGE